MRGTTFRIKSWAANLRQRCCEHKSKIARDTFRYYGRCAGLEHHEFDDEPKADEVHRIVRYGIYDASEGNVELAVLIRRIERCLESSPANQLEPRSRERPAVDDPVRYKDKRHN